MEELVIRPLEKERSWTAEEVPVLEARVSLPQPAEGYGRIRRFYALQCRSFLRYCQGELLPWANTQAKAALLHSTPVPCFQAELTWQETYRAGNLWSLYTQLRESAPPGPEAVRRWGDTWDLSTGYPVPLSAWFPPRTPWKKRLLAAAEAEIRRQERRGEARYHPDWPKRLRRAFHAQRYYLTPEGIAFFFPMYALAPAAEGVPTFLLPWEGEAPVRTEALPWTEKPS